MDKANINKASNCSIINESKDFRDFVVCTSQKKMETSIKYKTLLDINTDAIARGDIDVEATFPFKNPEL